jgi:hypothetical protein
MRLLRWNYFVKIASGDPVLVPEKLVGPHPVAGMKLFLVRCLSMGNLPHPYLLHDGKTVYNASGWTHL